jgi:hypothetical protein
LQHPVEKQPKIHLDGVEFTLKYGNGMRKVVANLGQLSLTSVAVKWWCVIG